MGRPLWFVNLLKSIYRRRYFAALATRIPIIGGVIDRFVFKGDSLVCLPKDNVIQIDASIFPQKETVLPSQVVDYFIEHANYHWIMNFCMCRESNKCKDYPRDLGCLFLGEATTKINPNIGRPVSKSEARDHMQKGREAGLVHFIGNVKGDALWLGVSPGNKLLTICNCCPCCCISGLIKYMAPQIAENYSKMVGVEVKVSDSCIGCGTCKKICFVDAIQIISNHAVINQSMCRGCGRCVERCPKHAIELSLHDPQFLQKTVKQIAKHVTLT
ncbi:MAG TPA: 4Fe-4S binding protein [Candidatus Deferrimicrobium sp.]|nr:4Fe-4S binding protein [Candidatus Deferrimicrobium sp.]